jgi:RNA polymerase sigma-70 factor, ECF subfamily
MTFSGFRINFNPRSGGEADLVDERIPVHVNANVTIEDKVTSLYGALRKPIFTYLLAVFGRDAAVEVEDVVQETFVRLQRSVQQGTQIENPRAWLFRAAHNLAIDRIRSRQFIAPLDDLEWDAICQTMPDPGLSPEQRTQRLEDFARLYESIKRLTLIERECLHLRAKGLKYKDISEVLDISVPAVGKALRRAIRKLMPDGAELQDD